MKARLSENNFLAFLLLILVLGLLSACGGIEGDEVAAPAGEEPTSAEEAPTLVGEPSGPAGLPTESPALSPEETLAEIDAQLSTSLQGNVAHSAPSSMEVGETAEVTLLISPSLSPEELVAEITEGGQIKTATINITPWMRAELVSPEPDAFTIRPLHGDAQQPLSTVEATGWRWLVTAEQQGSRRLILVVSRLVQVKGRESWRQVEEYRYAVEVSISLGTRLKQITAEVWDFKWWIGGLIFPILVYLIIRRLDRPAL